MCTVIVRVPDSPADPVRLLAVRDEDPARPWNPLGAWWPDRPRLVGVQDRLAGGAWLAAEDGRLAVLLNRAGHPDVGPERLESRGGIVLAAVAGQPPRRPRTLGFNLVEVDGAEVAVTSWDGASVRRRALEPGTHMLAHDDVDDESTPRIRAWRAAFADASTADAEAGWWAPWVDVLARSAALPASDDRAIIRDNHAHGYPTLSLLACVASIRPGRAEVRYAQLERAGAWNPLDFG